MAGEVYNPVASCYLHSQDTLALALNAIQSCFLFFTFYIKLLNKRVSFGLMMKM